MHTNPGLKLFAVTSFALFFAACGDVTRSTSARLGSTGGTLSLASGLEVEVPEGALPDDTTITLNETHHGDEVRIEVEPRGLELSSPANVSWNDDGRTPELESGEHLETERHGGRQTHHMSRLGTIVLRGHGGDDVDGGADDHGGLGHGADDADGGADDHGGLGHGADDADGGVDDHSDGGHGVDDADAGVDGGDDHGGSGGGHGGNGGSGGGKP